MAERHQTESWNYIEPESEEVNSEEASSNDLSTGAARALFMQNVARFLEDMRPFSHACLFVFFPQSFSGGLELGACELPVTLASKSSHWTLPRRT